MNIYQQAKETKMDKNLMQDQQEYLHEQLTSIMATTSDQRIKTACNLAANLLISYDMKLKDYVEICDNRQSVINQLRNKIVEQQKEFKQQIKDIETTYAVSMQACKEEFDENAKMLQDRNLEIKRLDNIISSLPAPDTPIELFLTDKQVDELLVKIDTSVREALGAAYAVGFIPQSVEPFALGQYLSGYMAVEVSAIVHDLLDEITAQ
jgi:hypothetical protein